MQNVPQEIIINSKRPTFYDTSTSVPGKIALEEHFGVDLFSGVFTTPFVNFTNEVNFDLPIYQADVIPRLKNIDSRVQQMDAASISMSILLLARLAYKEFSILHSLPTQLGGSMTRPLGYIRMVITVHALAFGAATRYRIPLVLLRNWNVVSSNLAE
jgi:hypothetical protein